jgi:hypothetical protein
VGVNGVESVGGVILIENEGGSRVENNDLGQGPESFVVEIGAVEEGVISIENEGGSEVEYEGVILI